MAFLEIGIPGDWHSWRLAFLEIGIPGDSHSWRLAFMEICIPGDLAFLEIWRPSLKLALSYPGLAPVRACSGAPKPPAGSARIAPSPNGPPQRTAPSTAGPRRGLGHYSGGTAHMAFLVCIFGPRLLRTQKFQNCSPASSVRDFCAHGLDEPEAHASNTCSKRAPDASEVLVSPGRPFANCV